MCDSVSVCFRYSVFQFLAGRRAGAGVQEPRAPGRALPEHAGDEGARVHLGRRVLGDHGRAGQDRLVSRAIRRLLRRLRRVHRLRLLVLLLRGGGAMDDAAARPRRAARAGVGARQLHGDGLLR